MKHILRSCVVRTVGGTFYRADFYTLEGHEFGTVFLALTKMSNNLVWLGGTATYNWVNNDTELQVYGFSFTYVSEYGDHITEEDIWL